MERQPIAISFKDRTYVKEGYEDKIAKEYDMFRYLVRVKDIYDVSECDGESFYIPCWQVDLLSGDFIRVEYMQNLIVVFSKD